MKKSIPILAAFIFIFGEIQSQEVYKSGGVTSSTFLLGFASYAAKSQCIFLPADLTNSASGDISTMYYRYGLNGGFTQILYNFTVQVGQTTDTTFASGNTFFTGLTTVFNIANHMIPAGASGNWFAIRLTTPYHYDKTQTLIVQLTFDSCAVNNWGTLGTSNTPVKKLISSDLNATTGNGGSSTWQDMGFDLAPTGIASASSSLFSLQVYPNPCHDKIVVNFQGKTANKNIHLTMMNILGEQVLDKRTVVTDPMSLDVSFLPTGIYLLTAEMDELRITKKVVVE